MGSQDGLRADAGCYDFSGETWAGDGSMHKGVMGAGSICLQRPTCNLVVRVGREEEVVSSLRPELLQWLAPYRQPQLIVTCSTSNSATVSRSQQGIEMDRKWPAYNARWRRKCRYHGIDYRMRTRKSAKWTVCTPSMTYEWSDNNGVKQTTAWSKTVRKAMVRGGAEYQVQEAMNHAVINWSKTFLRDTNAGLQTLHSICQAASKGWN